MSSLIEKIGFTHKEAFGLCIIILLVIGGMVLPPEAYEAFFSGVTEVSRDVIREEIEGYIDQGLGGSPYQTEKPQLFYGGVVSTGGTDYYYISGGLDGILDDYSVTESDVLTWLRTNMTEGGLFAVKNITGATGLGYEINNLSDTTSVGVYIFGQAGEALSQGELLYLETDGMYNLADCNASGTMWAVAVATNDTANEAWGLFLISGAIRVDGAYGDIPIGPTVPMYVSPTAGGITSNIPNSSGDQVQRIGYGVAFGTLWFDADSTVVEIA